MFYGTELDQVFQSLCSAHLEKTTYLILDPGLKVGLHLVVPVLSSLNISM